MDRERLTGSDPGRADTTAVVLAGGMARRLGQDKARATLAGGSMLGQVVRRLPTAVPIVVVSPDENVLALLALGDRLASGDREHAGVDGTVTRTCEFPPGGGPVAGLAAGLELVGTPTMLLLAVDMPLGVHAALTALDELVGSGTGHHASAVIPVDAGGHRQPLCAAYRTDALRSALTELVIAAGTLRGASVRSLLARLELVELPNLPGRLLLDVDTEVDLVAADRELRSSEWGSPEPG